MMGQMFLLEAADLLPQGHLEGRSSQRSLAVCSCHTVTLPLCCRSAVIPSKRQPVLEAIGSGWKQGCRVVAALICRFNLTRLVL